MSLLVEKAQIQNHENNDNGYKNAKEHSFSFVTAKKKKGKYI